MITRQANSSILLWSPVFTFVPFRVSDVVLPEEGGEVTERLGVGVFVELRGGGDVFFPGGVAVAVTVGVGVGVGVDVGVGVGVSSISGATFG